jgi:hypothetical protein
MPPEQCHYQHLHFQPDLLLHFQPFVFLPLSLQVSPIVKVSHLNLRLVNPKLTNMLKTTTGTGRARENYDRSSKSKPNQRQIFLQDASIA